MPEDQGFNQEHHTMAIGHIEHYANAGDFVSQFGVINYIGMENRFMGRLFLSPKSGHLLNQHYLYEMFPLDADERCAETNDFMEMEVNIKIENLSDSGRAELEAFFLHRGLKRTGSTFGYVGDVNSPISPIDRSCLLLGDNQLPKIKDFSRLWQYRNGRSPKD